MTIAPVALGLTLSAGPRGSVGIVYYASADPAAEALSGYISQTTDALSAHALFYSSTVNDPSHPIFENYGDSDSPRADFVGATYDAHGHFWGGLVKQLGAPDASNTIATTGYLVHLSFTRGRTASRRASSSSRQELRARASDRPGEARPRAHRRSA